MEYQEAWDQGVYQEELVTLQEPKVATEEELVTLLEPLEATDTLLEEVGLEEGTASTPDTTAKPKTLETAPKCHLFSHVLGQSHSKQSVYLI